MVALALLAGCASAANEPAPDPPPSTTTIAQMGVSCRSVDGFPYRAERCQ